MLPVDGATEEGRIVPYTTTDIPAACPSGSNPYQHLPSSTSLATTLYADRPHSRLSAATTIRSPFHGVHIPTGRLTTGDLLAAIQRGEMTEIQALAYLAYELLQTIDRVEASFEARFASLEQSMASTQLGLERVEAILARRETRLYLNDRMWAGNLITDDKTNNVGVTL